MVSQWFLTIFSYTIPTSLTLVVWYFIFYGGCPVMFRVASLKHLVSSRNIIFIKWPRGDRSHDERLEEIRHEHRFSHEGGDSDIMERAKLMVVTDKVLQQLQESCAMEMISMSESSISSGVNGMSWFFYFVSCGCRVECHHRLVGWWLHHIEMNRWTRVSMNHVRVHARFVTSNYYSRQDESEWFRPAFLVV